MQKPFPCDRGILLTVLARAGHPYHKVRHPLFHASLATYPTSLIALQCLFSAPSIAGILLDRWTLGTISSEFGKKKSMMSRR